MGTLIAEFGRCGFGASAGLFPEIRFGVVRVVITSQRVTNILAENNKELRKVLDALKGVSRQLGRSEVRTTYLEANLRITESARAQLELDLQTAVADKEKCLTHARDAIARNHDLEARLARFNRKVDPVTKRFVKECV